MAVKKAKEASFKKMDSAFATSQSAIQKVKNTDPLNGNEEQEQGNENVSIDPAHYLSKKEKKYKLSAISKDARHRTFEDSFLWLHEAMVVNTCFNAIDPNVGLALSAGQRHAKMLYGRYRLARYAYLYGFFFYGKRTVSGNSFR